MGFGHEIGGPAGRRRGIERLGAGGLLVLSTAVLLVALWSGLTVLLLSDRARVHDRVLGDTAILAKLVEEHLVGAVRQIDELTRRIAFEYERHGSDSDWFDLVREKRAANAPYFRAFGVADAAGRVLVHSADPAAVGTTIADRPGFQVHIRRDDGLFIGVPAANRNGGRPIIRFSRRLERGDGHFAGVAFVDLDSAFLTSLYAQLGLPPRSSVTITRADGPVLARLPDLEETVVGKSFAASGIYAALRRMPVGHYESPSAVDGIERVYSFRSNAEYPLIVVVGFDKGVAFADWRRRAGGFVAAAGVVTVAMILLTAFVARQQRRRAAEEAQYRAIVDTAATGIITVDAHGAVRSFNKAAERMFGLAESEAVGKGLTRLLPDAEEGGEWRPVERETVGRRKDGQEIPLDALAAEWRADGQRFVTLMLRDIGEQKRAERELEAARDQAEAASRAKSAFLANMSHELRTPLNGIIGFADIMRQQMLGPIGSSQYLEYAGDIHQSGRHLLDLINDILDLSKAEAGRLALHEETVDLKAIVDAGVRLLAGRAEAVAAVVVEIDERARYVRGDETRLRQVVLNLLSNAMKFTPPAGRVAVSAALEGGELVLRVADSGIGIPAAEHAAVMMPFVQVDNALTRRTQGTGLGLPLSKRLVELHGGVLVLDSRAGAGTTVSVRLPAARVLRDVA